MSSSVSINEVEQLKTGPKTLPLARNAFELDLLERWMMLGYAKRTLKLYLTTVRACRTWCEQHGYEIGTMPVHAVMEYADTIPNTWSSRRALRSALDAYWLAIQRDNAPVKAIRVPTKPQMVSKAIDEGPAAALARAARARRDRRGAAVLLGLYLGLRRFEIAGLRWSDFEEDLSWVTFVGKRNVTASLPVHQVVREALRYIHPADPRAVWVFPSPGGHVCPATIWDWSRRVSKDANLPPIPPHVLRHTCLTTANDNTHDLRSVQAFARHSRPETTAGYTRVRKSQLIGVMESLNYEEAS